MCKSVFPSLCPNIPDNVTPDTQHLWHSQGMRSDGAGLHVLPGSENWLVVVVQLRCSLWFRWLHGSETPRDESHSRLSRRCPSETRTDRGGTSGS